MGISWSAPEIKKYISNSNVTLKVSRDEIVSLSGLVGTKIDRLSLYGRAGYSWAEFELRSEGAIRHHDVESKKSYVKLNGLINVDYGTDFDTGSSEF